MRVISVLFGAMFFLVSVSGCSGNNEDEAALNRCAQENMVQAFQSLGIPLEKKHEQKELAMVEDHIQKLCGHLR